MTEDETGRLARAVESHGEQLGNNLVHLKRFLKGLQDEQQSFITQQREASDAAQKKSHRAAFWSAVAAVAAAFAAAVQAYAALAKP